MDDVTIEICITNPMNTKREITNLRYTIAYLQAEALHIGPPPPEIDVFRLMDWRLRADRAESFAKHIAADIAHKIIMIFNEESV